MNPLYGPAVLKPLLDQPVILSRLLRRFPWNDQPKLNIAEPKYLCPRNQPFQLCCDRIKEFVSLLVSIILIDDIELSQGNEDDLKLLLSCKPQRNIFIKALPVPGHCQMIPL